MFEVELDEDERDVTLATCLNAFQKQEQLGADDTWYEH